MGYHVVYVDRNSNPKYDFFETIESVNRFLTSFYQTQTHIPDMWIDHVFYGKKLETKLVVDEEK